MYMNESIERLIKRMEDKYQRERRWLLNSAGRSSEDVARNEGYLLAISELKTWLAEVRENND